MCLLCPELQPHQIDLLLFAVPEIVDVSQERVAHGFVGRRHALLHMHGEHADDMVIQTCCEIFQTPVVFTGKVVAMIQEAVHDLRYLCCPVVLVEDNAAFDKLLKWIVIRNSHKNHSGTQHETNEQ